MSERQKDRPWLMRTYAGHSTAEASNELYRRNLAKGQTGLSVAFDLPTQTGYHPDPILARGDVGQVVAEEHGAEITKLQGTTQNDSVKEYLWRGTHVFPPGPSLRLPTDMICYT